MASTNGSSVKERVREQREQRHRESRIQQVRRRASHDRTITEFQPDAIEIENRRIPGGARWTLYSILALITAFVAWSYWAEVDLIVVGQGELVTTENAVVVQSFSTAPILSMHARFGDIVRAGQLVAKLDPTFSTANLIQLRSRQNSLDATSRRLRAELDETDFDVGNRESDRDWETQAILFRERKLAFEAELERLEADLAKLKVQEQNTIADIKFNEEELKTFLEVEASIKPLAERRSVSDIEYKSAQLRTMGSRRTLKTSTNANRELAAEIDAKTKQRKSFIAGRRSEIADELLKASQELSAVEQEIHKAERMDQLLELRVPTDAGFKEFVVFEVADRSVGSVLGEGEALFKLIPLDVPLEAEVEISGRDVARIRAFDAESDKEEIPNGSSVKLKLAAYDYQDHGTLSGTVRTISEGVFEDPNAARIGGPDSHFKARIKLKEPAVLRDVPPHFRLMPGMSTTAEIKVGKRKVIQYFLYPILRYLDEGLREP
jgi:HlyD family secretion protein